MANYGASSWQRGAGLGWRLAPLAQSGPDLSAALLLARRERAEESSRELLLELLYRWQAAGARLPARRPAANGQREPPAAPGMGLRFCANAP